MSKLHLLLFADNHLNQYGLNSYNKKAQKLIQQAHEFNLFSKIHMYTANDLFTKFPEYFDLHKDFINSNFSRNCWRGYGYWIWKPFLIWKTLQEINEGDILLYMDTGCQLHSSGIERFKEYLDIVKKNQHGNLFIEHHDLIKTCTKMDTLKHYKAENFIDENTRVTIATFLFTTNNEFNRHFFELFYNACCNYHLVDDSPTIAPNISEFIEHRHDQSILSILTRQMCPSSLSSVPYEEIYHEEKMDDPAYAKYPITIHSNRA